MHLNKLLSAAAAMAVAGMTLYAAPDNAQHGNDQRPDRSYTQGKSNGQGNSGTQDRSYSQNKDRSGDQGKSNTQERSYNKDSNPGQGEMRREEVHRSEPKKYAPHPVKPTPPPKYPVAPGTIVRSDKSKHYYRPPSARPLPYYHRPGYVIHTLPRVAVTLSIGGLLFYYADGIYYKHASSGFIVSVPPIGLIVTTLPVGYTVFVMSGRTYYYYADVYYVWDSYRAGYRVVEAPVDDSAYQPGDIVESLPDGASAVTINGMQYYRYDNLYFMQTIQGNRIVYIVVNP